MFSSDVTLAPSKIGNIEEQSGYHTATVGPCSCGARVQTLVGQNSFLTNELLHQILGNSISNRHFSRAGQVRHRDTLISTILVSSQVLHALRIISSPEQFRTMLMVPDLTVDSA